MRLRKASLKVALFTPLFIFISCAEAWAQQSFAKNPGLAQRVDGLYWKATANAAVRGVEWVQQDRGAVFNQPGEYVRLRVKWSSPTVISGMRLKRDYETYFPLYDDGSHGDLIAGDGIWSADSLSVYKPGLASMYRVTKDSKYGSAVYSWYPIEWQVSGGEWENDGYAYVRLGFVDPMVTFDVQELGTGIWATEYCCFIEDSLQSQRTFPGYPVTDKSFSYLMQPAANLLFTHFPDAFDFLVVTPATPIWLPNPLLLERVPNASTLRNSLQGIGLTSYDNSAGWGTAGKLRTVVYHSNGPFNMLAHELGHGWMAYLDSLTFSNGACGVHWAENQTIGGNMSLWPKIIETSPGVFKGVMQHTPDAFNASFSNLDLYLMGLAPLSQVPPLKRLNNPDFTNPDSVRYSSITTTNPSTLPARYGVRLPAYPSAQHDFNMATVVVKPAGWTNAEFAWFSLLAKHAADSLDDGWGYTYNFEKAARGLATLESKMFTPTGVPSLPAMIAPADGATGQPLSVVLAWNPSLSATGYSLELSQSNDFTDTLLRRATVTGTSWLLHGLTPGTTYYWRIRASSAAGLSRFSEARSFTTSGSNAVEDMPGQLDKEYALYDNYPNPFNPSTTISFALPERSRVTLSVFNALGQLVATMVEGELEAGHHALKFTAAAGGTGLSSGVYYYRMQARSASKGSTRAFVQSKAFVIVK